MGSHIDDRGRFQSDKHPDLPPDKIRLSFTNERSWPALAALAESYEDLDAELARDIRARLASARAEARQKAALDSVTITRHPPIAKLPPMQTQPETCDRIAYRRSLGLPKDHGAQ